MLSVSVPLPPVVRKSPLFSVAPVLIVPLTGFVPGPKCTLSFLGVKVLVAIMAS